MKELDVRATDTPDGVPVIFRNQESVTGANANGRHGKYALWLFAVDRNSRASRYDSFADEAPIKVSVGQAATSYTERLN